MITIDFFVSILPLVMLLVFAIWVKLPTPYSSVICFVFTIILSHLYFRFPFNEIIKGFIQGKDKHSWTIAIIIVWAVLYYYLLDKSGVFPFLKKILLKVSKDPRIQAIIIAWLGANILGPIFGVGLWIAIASSILIMLGFNVKKALLISVIANMTSDIFTKNEELMKIITQIIGIDDISNATTIASNTPKMIIPFIIVGIAGNGLSAIKDTWPAAFLCGISSLIGEYVTINFVSKEDAVLISNIISLIAIIVQSNLSNTSIHIVQEPASGKKKMRKKNIQLLPVIVCGIEIFGSIFDYGKSTLNKMINMQFYTDKPLTDKVGAHFINTQGLIIIAVSITTSWLIRNVVGPQKSLSIIKENLNKIFRDCVSVLFVIFFVNLMNYSGMINIITTGTINGIYKFLN